jgi:formamidopyrimidine-DNA glycosylase
VGRGGSTLRDHLSADGAPGTAQRWHQVYGRAGRPCVRCGRALSSDRLAGRTTVWCKACQS